MNKKEILTVVKADLQETIAGLDMKNVKDIQEKSLKYFHFIEILNELPENSADKSEETNDEHKNDVSEKNTSRFYQKLKGGYLPDIPIFVPESICRKLQIEHGDWVRANEMEPGKFYYEVLKKNKDLSVSERLDDSGIRSYKYCPVEQEGGMLWVRKTLLEGGKDIRVNEIPHTFLLNYDHRQDVQDINLNVGDIVDINYYENEPDKFRVVWKHPVETTEDTASPKISGFYKEKETSSKERKDVFRQKSILVVGFEPRKPIFQEQIERFNGQFLWADGHYSKGRLQPLIKKADAVILLILFMKHQASHDAVDLCKLWNVPFREVHNFGVRTVIDTAYNLLFDERETVDL